MFNQDILIKELKFKAIRSSGAGGQHVNKVSSKIELTFHLKNSTAISEDQKNLLLDKLSHRLTKDFVLIMQCDENRSQHRNKELVIKRFLELIELNLTIPKIRKATTIPKSVIKKRLKNKNLQSEKKASRKKPDIE